MDLSCMNMSNEHLYKGELSPPSLSDGSVLSLSLARSFILTLAFSFPRSQVLCCPLSSFASHLSMLLLNFQMPGVHINQWLASPQWHIPATCGHSFFLISPPLLSPIYKNASCSAVAVHHPGSPAICCPRVLIHQGFQKQNHSSPPALIVPSISTGGSINGRCCSFLPPSPPTHTTGWLS